ncbi:hypothetical protein C8Q74DRAFT_794932 [Fomes fomentarius]|nr:hypothetical protein C8Q74DRAFT_794932 [Fomes fomentarius]
MRPFCYEFADRGTCRRGEGCRYTHVSGDEYRKMLSAAQASKSHDPASESSTPSVDHIAQFFATYPTFSYNRSVPFMDGFFDLCDVMVWGRESAERLAALRRLEDAMAQQFNDMYGTDVDDIRAWQRVCVAIGINPVPNELKECRAVVLRSRVNLCDLISAPSLGRPRRFPSATSLATYSERTGRIFPRRSVHAGRLLRYLLDHLYPSQVIGSRRIFPRALEKRRGRFTS